MSLPNERTSLLSSTQHDQHASDDRPPSPAHSITTRFFEHVAEGIQEQDRIRFQGELTRYIAFAWAIVTCLCAGGIATYSLYGHLFQERLLYTQIQVNTVSICAEVALYLPVPLFGLLCDRKGPAWSASLGGLLFGIGYFLAAFTYRAGALPERGGHGYPMFVMCLAFITIGAGTCSMYLGAVTTCAKNFGRGKHKGFALAAPIASFGLGSMWQSQIGQSLLVEHQADGTKGQVDVFRYFMFLGGLLLGIGLIAPLLLRVVDEDALVTEAIEELERSGLLTQSQNGRGTRPSTARTITYDTIQSTQSLKSTLSALPVGERKSALLNNETAQFLSDPSMWLLAAGFFLVTGPGEAFINNLGTVIGTLYPSEHSNLPETSIATHVSIVAATSTVARLVAGTLSDMLAPSVEPHQRYRNSARTRTRASEMDDNASSVSSLDPIRYTMSLEKRRYSVSRVIFLECFAVALSAGLLILASGIVQNRAASLFWLVSGTVGAGYGAVFSLVPIIISSVWGVENFGTNWGIVAVAPAGGAAVAGYLYALVYEAGTGDHDGGQEKCYGRQCYASAFWAMTVAVCIACIIWLFAWRMWKRRDIAV